MKLFVLLLLALVLAGCSKTKPAANEVAPQASETADPTPILVPSREKIGRVAMVNESARFVVLRFPIGEVPSKDKLLSVYRNEVKVGELRVTGPEKETDTVATIVTGTPLVNDEVRGE